MPHSRTHPAELLGLALAILAAALLAPPAAPRADAMPTFAQAYGLDCRTCHTEVPSLNAYGRYIQRTMYAGLDPKPYAHEFPIWIGWIPSYSSTNDSPKLQVGNLDAHAVGVYGGQNFPNWTFHVQQWIVQNNDTGDLDTMWVSYNHLLASGNAHFVLGKMPGPGPSFWSQWSDLSPFAPAAMTIGEHVQSLGANRWGAKLTYGDARFYGEAGYYGSAAGLGGVTQWGATPDNLLDKGWQWTAAFQRPDKPVSVGIVGNAGSWPLAEGGFDRYRALGEYAQVDPTKRLPGALFYYQTGYDDNPLAAGIPAHSRGYSAEIYFPFLAHKETIIGLRREMTDDGLGTVTNTGEINLGFRIFRYLHADFEAGLANGTTPVWGYYLWLAAPFGYNGHVTY